MGKNYSFLDLLCNYLKLYRRVPFCFFYLLGCSASAFEILVRYINSHDWLNLKLKSEFASSIIIDHIPYITVISLFSLIIILNIVTSIVTHPKFKFSLKRVSSNLILRQTEFCYAAIFIVFGYLSVFVIAGILHKTNLSSVAIIIPVFFVIFFWYPFSTYIMHKTLKETYSNKERLISSLICVTFIVFIFSTYIYDSYTSTDKEIKVKINSTEIEFLKSNFPDKSPEEAIKQMLSQKKIIKTRH